MSRCAFTARPHHRGALVWRCSCNAMRGTPWCHWHQNACYGCGRRFRTPQGLGLHFAAIKRGAKTCIARTARAGE